MNHAKQSGHQLTDHQLSDHQLFVCSFLLAKPSVPWDGQDQFQGDPHSSNYFPLSPSEQVSITSFFVVSLIFCVQGPWTVYFWRLAEIEADFASRAFLTTSLCTWFQWPNYFLKSHCEEIFKLWEFLKPGSTAAHFVSPEPQSSPWTSISDHKKSALTFRMICVMLYLWQGSFKPCCSTSLNTPYTKRR